MRSQLINFPIEYNDDEEHIKTHPLLLPKIEVGTKGEELKKNPIGSIMKSNKMVVEKLSFLMEMDCIKLQRSCCPNRSRHRQDNKGVCWTDTFHVTWRLGLETTVRNQWVVNTCPS